MFIIPTIYKRSNRLTESIPWSLRIFDWHLIYILQCLQEISFCNNLKIAIYYLNGRKRFYNYWCMFAKLYVFVSLFPVHISWCWVLTIPPMTLSHRNLYESIDLSWRKLVNHIKKCGGFPYTIKKKKKEQISNADKLNPFLVTFN